MQIINNYFSHFLAFYQNEGLFIIQIKTRFLSAIHIKNFTIIYNHWMPWNKKRHEVLTAVYKICPTSKCQNASITLTHNVFNTRIVIIKNNFTLQSNTLIKQKSYLQR